MRFWKAKDEAGEITPADMEAFYRKLEAGQFDHFNPDLPTAIANQDKVLKEARGLMRLYVFMQSLFACQITIILIKSCTPYTQHSSMPFYIVLTLEFAFLALFLKRLSGRLMKKKLGNVLHLHEKLRTLQGLAPSDLLK